MKCIRNIKTEQVERVKDQKAEEAVASGLWKFVPKSLWKAQSAAEGSNGG